MGGGERDGLIEVGGWVVGWVGYLRSKVPLVDLAVEVFQGAAADHLERVGGWVGGWFV